MKPLGVFLFVLALIAVPAMAEDTSYMSKPPATYDCSDAISRLMVVGQSYSNPGSIICVGDYPNDGNYNCPSVRYDSDVIPPNGAFYYSEQCTSVPSQCPQNSTESPDGNACICPSSTHYWSFDSGNTYPACVLYIDPCESLTADCAATCGGADKVNASCGSSKGVLTAPYACRCKDDTDPTQITNDPCDIPGGGVGCATADQQDAQTKVLEEIKAAIEAGNLKQTDISGIFQKTDGTITDIKTLLTQIANSPGILSSGGGSGGSGTGTGTGSGEGDGDTFTAPGAGKGYGDATSQIQTTINERKQELKAKIGEIKQGFLAAFASSTPAGTGELPCWQNLRLFGAYTFDICFSDYSEQLSIIPNFLWSLSLVFAVIILVKPKTGD